MRWLGCLVLVGCYSPAGVTPCTVSCNSSTECPGELTCNTAMHQCTLPQDPTCAMVGVDAPIGSDVPLLDGPPMLGCVAGKTFTGNPVMKSVQGTSYSSDSAKIVLFEDTTQQGQIFETTLADTGMATQVVFPVAGGTTVSRPQLSSLSQPAEAFLLLGGGPTFKWAKSKRNSAANWTAPVDVVTSGIVVGPSFTFGQPTANLPRRIVATAGVTIQEGIEQPDKSWSFNPAFTFPNITNIEDPNLSKDGLALVFLGKSQNIFRAFLATRSGIDEAFDSPTALPDNLNRGSGTEHTPAFGPDCELLISLDTTVLQLQ